MGTSGPTSMASANERFRKSTTQLVIIQPTRVAQSTPVSQPTPEFQSAARRLTVPQKYHLLEEQFRVLDVVMKLRSNRRTPISKLTAVCAATSNEFGLKQVGQIKTVYPTAYNLRQEKLPDGEPGYHLTIEANLEDTDQAASEKNVQFKPHHLAARRACFHAGLIHILKQHHKEFLSKRSCSLSIPDGKTTRWHPKFCLDDVPDVEVAALPEPPVVSGATDLLAKHEATYTQVGFEDKLSSTKYLGHEMTTTGQDPESSERAADGNDSVGHHPFMISSKGAAGRQKYDITDTKAISKNTQKNNKCRSDMFRQYLKEKSLPENFEDFSAVQLAEVLGKYYLDARTKTGELYKAATFDNMRHGLNRHLHAFPHCKKFDIITSPEFRDANECFQVALAEIKKSGKGAVTHYSKITAEDLAATFQSDHLNPSTPAGLLNRVQMNIRLFLCKRANENVENMTKDTFKVCTYSDGTKYVVEQEDESSKLKNYSNKDSTVTAHMPQDKNNASVCPVATFELYLEKLNPDCNKLWQYPLEFGRTCNENDPTWYQNRPFGRDALLKFMSRLSKKVPLSQIYSNQSIRITANSFDFKSAKFLCNISYDKMPITPLESVSTLAMYQRVTDSQKQAMDTVIHEAVLPKSQTLAHPALQLPVLPTMQTFAVPALQYKLALPTTSATVPSATAISATATSVTSATSATLTQQQRPQRQRKKPQRP